MFVGTGADELDLIATAIDAAIDALAAVDHGTMTGAQRRAHAKRLAQLCTRLEAQRIRQIASLDAHGDAEAVRARNTRAWLRHECNVSGGDAGRDVRAARRLREFPKWEHDFAEGAVTRSHVDALVKAATPERIGQLAEFETELLHQAQVFAPEKFGRLIARACELIDDDHGASMGWEQFQARSVYVATTTGGIGVLNGNLAPETNALVNSVLEQYMASDPDREGHPRTVAQRRHDALHRMARDAQACTCRDRDLAQPRALADVTVVADLDAITGNDDLKAEVRAEAAHAGRLSTATLRRLTCDAKISRVLTDGPSQVLDVGRARRTIPPALWRALVARDGGCVKCGAPPEQCEVHHKHHWAAGGETNLDNTELACWYCHVLEHEGKGRGP